MTPREQLADLLQRSRVETGYGSQGALAKRLNVSRPVISKAENSAQPCPSYAILAAWAGATGCPLDRLTELAEQARSGVPDWFVPWRATETSASLLRYWQPLIVPGMSQTVGYMRALFADEGHHLDQADELVSARLERQQLIGLPETVTTGSYGGVDIAAGDDTTTVCLSALEDVTSTERKMVSKALVAWERLLGAAESRTESLTLIRSAEEQWKSQT